MVPLFTVKRLGIRAKAAVLTKLIAVASIGVAATIPFAAPASAQLRGVSGGTPISVSGLFSCTITAAGYDKWDQAVAFTASHCGQLRDPVSVNTETGSNVIGIIVANNPVLDYAVIELFADRAVPVRQPGITGIGTAPGIGGQVCKDGRSTGHTCGFVWSASPDEVVAQVCARQGDSGGPVTSGGRLVAMAQGGRLNLGSVVAPLVPCGHPLQYPFFSPLSAKPVAQIFGDATRRDIPGAGFRLAL